MFRMALREAKNIYMAKMLTQFRIDRFGDLPRRTRRIPKAAEGDEDAA
jgi:hypothetical protein